MECMHLKLLDQFSIRLFYNTSTGEHFTVYWNNYDTNITSLNKVLKVMIPSLSVTARSATIRTPDRYGGYIQYGGRTN